MCKHNITLLVQVDATHQWVVAHRVCVRKNKHPEHEATFNYIGKPYIVRWS